MEQRVRYSPAGSSDACSRRGRGMSLTGIRGAGRVILTLGILAGVALQSSCVLARPMRAEIGLPSDMDDMSEVSFPSASGSTLRAWFVPGRAGLGAVLLLHGVGSNRTSMLGRVRFLHARGYAVLAPDFQAHGESSGEHVTYGVRESLDA